MSASCSCPVICAFRWKDDPRPSIFVRDHHGVWNGNGRDPSQRATETKDRIEAETGRNLAEIGRLSRRANWATVR